MPIFFPSIIYSNNTEIILEDFEDENLWSPVSSLGWWRLDEVYDYTLSESVAFKGRYSMRVKYEKTKSYQIFGGYIDNTSPKKDFSKYDKFSMMVYGKVKILLKLEDRFDNQSNVGIKTSLKKDEWNRLDFDLTHLTGIDKTNIKNIFFFFEPGQVDVDGIVYIDNISVFKKDDKAEDIIIKNKQAHSFQDKQKIPIVSAWDFDFDNENNIYILQRLAGLVIKYNKDGTYLDDLSRFGSNVGELKYPEHIVFDSQKEKFYILDSGNNRIQKFYKNGILDSSFGYDGEFSYQSKNKFVDIDIDDNGFLYLLDQNQNSVYKYSNDSGLLSFISDFFIKPIKIKIIDNYIYVLDIGSKSIEKFDPTGRFIESIKCQDNSEKEFEAVDFAYDYKSKKYFVLAKNNNSIIVFNSNWKYLGQSDYLELDLPISIDIIDLNKMLSVMFVSDYNKMEVISVNLDNINAKIN